MTFDLPTVQAKVAHYAKLQGLAAEGWRFTVEIVAGLLHQGEPAWAVVESDPTAKTARIQVRDLARTPIPGVADQWHELEVTISHELWHPWITWLLADPTVEREEKMVEAAAQAVVAAKGADARTMARGIQSSLRAVPTAVRARLTKISALATVRARGGTMDENTVKEALAAIEGGDAEKAKTILVSIIAALAAKGAEGGGMPPAPPPMDDLGGDPMEAPIEAREEDMADDPTKKPADAPRPVARKVDPNEARARRAADKSAQVYIRGRLAELRRDGVTLDAAFADELAKMTDDDAFDRRIGDVLRGRAMTTELGRARSGERPGAGAPPPPAAAKYDAAKLIAEGINPTLAAQIAATEDHATADLTLTAARARLASSKPTWPTAKPNGGVS